MFAAVNMASPFFDFSLFICFLFSLVDFVFGVIYPTASYNLVKDYEGGTDNFFNHFNFYTGQDPTHGFVKYPTIWRRNLRLVTFPKTRLGMQA